jgi:type II secretory pathway pseudopilin PulG
MHSKTPVKKPLRSRRGFTLVEIVITMSIVMLLLGVTVLGIRSVSGERRLREVTSELKQYARQARTQAMLEQRAFQILFTPTFFSAQALQLVEEGEEFEKLFIAEGEATRASELKRFTLPEGVQIEVKHWNEKELRPPKPDTWVFEHSGICEPFTVRVSSDDGFIEMVFHPLTAAVEDEVSEIGG